uniref:Uncharacterized protein n=1 Tax=Acrobeloides nanus TaxID=290746 RepID=A0A914BW87_9BILA
MDTSRTVVILIMPFGGSSSYFGSSSYLFVAVLALSLLLWLPAVVVAEMIMVHIRMLINRLRTPIHRLRMPIYRVLTMLIQRFTMINQRLAMSEVLKKS